VNVYEPVAAELVRVKSRISADSWQQRVEQAQRDEVLVRAILDQITNGMSLNAAIASVLLANRRSWALRRNERSLPRAAGAGAVERARRSPARSLGH